METFFKRYEEEAKRAIDSARNEALLRGATAISPEHLLLGLSWEEKTRAAAIASLKDRLPNLCARLGTPVRPCSANRHDVATNIPLHSDTKTSLAYAAQEAEQERSRAIDTDHLLRGLLHFSNKASDALKAEGIDLAGMRAAAEKHRIQFPSARASMRWMIGQIWRMAWPVVWRLGLVAVFVLAIVLAIYFLHR